MKKDARAEPAFASSLYPVEVVNQQGRQKSHFQVAAPHSRGRQRVLAEQGAGRAR